MIATLSQLWKFEIQFLRKAKKIADVPRDTESTNYRIYDI